MDRRRRDQYASRIRWPEREGADRARTATVLRTCLRFAVSRGHDQKDAILTLGNRLYCCVNGVALVVARRLPAAVVEVILEDDLFLVRRQALPRTVFSPQFSGRCELIQGEVASFSGLVPVRS